MSDKQSPKKRNPVRRASSVILAAVLFASLSACSAAEQTPVETPSPTVVKTFAPPTQTPPPTTEPSPSPSSSPTAPPTTKPTPVVSFPPFEVDASGDYVFPQVVADKTEAMTNETVNFKLVTSENVNSIRTVIDGEEQTRVYKDYKTENGRRIWQTHISFTKGGSRRVQFKCGMASGGNALIPKSPIKINVTFDYTAESTSKTISSGKTVTFTLKTPDTIDSVDVLVDGVKQNLNFDKPDSSEGGISIWKLNVTFFKKGTRSVTFEVYDGSKLKATFPDPGIPIIVE